MECRELISNYAHEIASTFDNGWGNTSTFLSPSSNIINNESANLDVDPCAIHPDFTTLSASAWPGIVAYLILFIISSVGNFVEFFVVLERLRKRCTPMNSLLMNLCIADIIVVITIAPVEVAWRISIGWYAGNFLCIAVQFLRAFGLYLSSLVLICLSLDRYYAVLHPLRVVDASARVKLMLTIAWIFSGILAAPQLVVYGVLHHPMYPEFTQCKSVGETAELINTIISLCFMYFLPFVIIVFSYGNIIYKLTKENERCHAGGTRGTAMLLRRSDVSVIDRAKIRALKLTFVIVLVFILCWSPYVVISMWHVIDRESAEQLNPFLQDALFIMVVANSCANPLVYGVFHSGRKPTSSSTTTSAYTMSTYTRRSRSRSCNLPSKERVSIQAVECIDNGRCLKDTTEHIL